MPSNNGSSKKGYKLKKLTKLLIASSLLVNISVHANQVTDKKFVAQVNLGGAYTSVNDYSGMGYKASAKILFPMSVDGIDFYGKISEQASYDEKQGNDFYFDETEVTLGIAYNVSNEHSVFLEGGDIKQSLDQNAQGVWKDYASVARFGTKIKKDNYNFQLALEYRDGMESDLGYSYTIDLFENRMSFSYTDVGDYESIGLSVQAHF